MRTRLIRPAMFSDEVMAGLPFATRWVYMGTWCLADDAGYLEWKPREIGVEILPHEAPARRARLIDTGLAELIAAGRIRLLECGLHAVIPTIPDHRIRGGEQLFTIRKRHQVRCASVGLHSPLSDSVSDSSTDSVSDSVSSNARTHDAKKRPGESIADWAQRIAASAAPARIGFRPPEASDE